MRYLIPILCIMLLSCGGTPSDKLIAENEQLKAEVERFKADSIEAMEMAKEAEASALRAQQEAERAMELAELSEARARAAQMEAEAQREAAQQALEDCESK